MTNRFLQFVLQRASELYGFNASAAEEAPGHKGGRNRVCLLNGKRVLRISGLSDRAFEDYLAETEYVHYLAQNGASVSDVCASASGHFVEKCEDGGEECELSVFRVAKGDGIAEHGYRYREGAPIEECFFFAAYDRGGSHGEYH